MEMIFQLLRCFRRCFWRLRRFWKSVYYGVTNFLMIVGCSVLLSGLWYYLFCVR